MKNTCETCRWSDNHPMLGQRCHRYPTPSTVGVGHWCGEHQAKPAAPVKKEPVIATHEEQPKPKPRKSRSSRKASV